MSNDIKLGTEGRNKLKQGVDKISNIVKSTLGAKGRNVIMSMTYGYPQITKDGVSVARAINLKDPIENMGALLIKEVCEKTVSVSGDGTTTAAVLAQSIISLGTKAVEAGSNPVDVKNGIEKAAIEVVNRIKSFSQKVDTTEKLKQVATISANNDAIIGKVIADGYALVGNDGLITTEEGVGYETTIRKVEGLEFDKGYISYFFVTDQSRMKCELNNPLILLFGRELKTMKELLPLLEKVVMAKRSLLIICTELEGQAFATLVENKVRGVINVCVVKSPSFGMNQQLVMEDLSVLTGGKYITDEVGMKLENATIEMLGEAEKVIVDKDSCRVIGGKGNKTELEQRCAAIQSQIDIATKDYDKTILSIRLGKLKNGIAILSIGGVTETEIREKKDRIEDALCATKAANEEGFVAGGGSTFMKVLNFLNDVKGENDDENIGIGIIKKTIQEPFRQILRNGGVEAADYIKEVRDSEYGKGFNIKTNTMENLLDSGVIDPTKVLRVALENAVSIGTMFLITDGVVFPELTINQ